MLLGKKIGAVLLGIAAGVLFSCSMGGPERATGAVAASASAPATKPSGPLQFEAAIQKFEAADKVAAPAPGGNSPSSSTWPGSAR